MPHIYDNYNAALSSHAFMFLHASHSALYVPLLASSEALEVLLLSAS